MVSKCATGFFCSAPPHMVVLKTLLWVLSSWLLCFWEQKRREEVVLRLLCSVSVHREPLWKQHVVPRSKESWQRIIEGKNYSIIKNFCLKKPFLEKFRRFIFTPKNWDFLLAFPSCFRRLPSRKSRTVKVKPWCPTSYFTAVFVNKQNYTSRLSFRVTWIL